SDLDELADIVEEVVAARNAGVVTPHPFAKRGESAHQLTSEASKLLAASISLAFKGEVDFDDQIYMPAIFGTEAMFAANSYATIIVDEAQDFSSLNILFLSLMKPKRLIVIGDPLQSIYGFRGAKRGAMEALMGDREYTELALTKSFRVPHKLSLRQIEHAPGFHSHPDLPQGLFEAWREWKLSDVEDGMTVLCRNNAPLFSLCFRFLATGRGASIVGKDISASLGALLRKVCGNNPDIDKLRAWMQAYREQYPNRAGIMQDKIDCLCAFLSTFEGTTQQAREQLSVMFKQGQPITLSTGHRAKGLEWDTVIHLDPWRIDAALARMEEGSAEAAQERNVRYVIETRAKQKLILANSSLLAGD
ncbi:MAG: UvrD-helicase domain-containing protein, partial [Casimicrobium sp.]